MTGAPGMLCLDHGTALATSRHKGQQGVLEPCEVCGWLRSPWRRGEGMRKTETRALVIAARPRLLLLACSLAFSMALQSVFALRFGAYPGFQTKTMTSCQGLGGLRGLLRHDPTARHKQEKRHGSPNQVPRSRHLPNARLSHQVDTFAPHKHTGHDAGDQKKPICWFPPAIAPLILNGAID